MMFSKTIDTLKAKLQQFKEENFKLRGNKPSTRKAAPPDPEVEKLPRLARQVHDLNAELQAEQEENAALKAQSPAAPAPTPQAALPPSIAKPITTPTSMTTVIPSALKPAAAITAASAFDPLKESKILTREMFDSLSHEARAKYIQSGGSLVAELRHASDKDVAAESIKRMQDPHEAALAMLKGMSLPKADVQELLAERFLGRCDASFKRYSEADLKAAMDKAEKSTRPAGYLRPAQAGVGLGGRTKIFGFKKPGEVSEPDRLAAETELMRLYSELEKIEDPTVRTVWWERNRAQVNANAVNETRRGSQWIGVFIGMLPHNFNVHIVQG